MSVSPRAVAAAGVCVWGFAAGASDASARVADLDRAALTSPRLAVGLAPRAAGSFAAWSSIRDTYDASYAKPSRWQLRVDGCGSLVDGKTLGPTNPAPSPFWLLTPLDGQVADGQLVAPIALASETGPGTCSRTLTLPALGRWQITMSVENAAGQTVSVTQTPMFRDVLLAAIGDSFASGEGNKAGGWVDNQCHQSTEAWPAILAGRLENATTTVTYLNFACSGAVTSNLVDTQYGGMEPSGQAKLAPQLRALRSLLGDPLAPSTRTVDALVGSIGIGDMSTGVSDLLTRCSIAAGPDAGSCVVDLSHDIARLPSSYTSLELAISANLRLGHAHLVGYPARVFTDNVDHFKGCDVFRFIDRNEMQWISETVTSINSAFASAARRYGWSFTGITNLFRTHGYCAGTALPLPPSERWLRHALESKGLQGNLDGTAHPNTKGHRATAELVAKTLRIDVPAPPPDRFTVRFLRVRATNISHFKAADRADVTLAVQSGFRNVCGHTNEQIVVSMNHSVDLTANRCVRFDVRTVGRTIAVSASTFLVTRLDHGKPNHGTQPPQATRARLAQPFIRSVGPFRLRQLQRRGQGWNATPSIGPTHAVRHIVGNFSGARIEVDYELTKDPVLARTP